MLLLAVATVAVSAGVGYAAIPGSNGVINGCFEKRTGLLRVSDAEAGKSCLSLETPISWSQQGAERRSRAARAARRARGSAGPALLAALDGTPCTTAAATAGTVSVVTTGDGTSRSVACRRIPVSGPPNECVDAEPDLQSDATFLGDVAGYGDASSLTTSGRHCADDEDWLASVYVIRTSSSARRHCGRAWASPFPEAISISARMT